MCTENRVSGYSGNHLSTVRPKNSAILDLDNGKFIPSKEEHMLQRQDYSTIVSQIIVRNIVCLHFLSQCAPQHIKHQYQSELTKKTETVAFDYFYHPGATSDQCTLFSDRNLINRNVVEEVKNKFSACKQFFNVEIEARIVATCSIKYLRDKYY
ncbi:Hypothetical predicted protein [Paramuricea clavata]|uniref:Uncharacterized protein n=1 Tax=Paramuricea clavata TaxID=317549 RepID=A0A6S7JTX5_PARCT|nr:Hypothetical predicted protein [Paramuricea clavata]